ncbi:MAG: Glu-tRNA(Gln) amidotransferase subunit GatD [Methanocalculaceae archaeon]|jgi:glutamyl-tRNA(Gln) amidotransferase subunit D|nr:Glu-tRNA(Gln) amidotransferase subunit GatD [Methanocalculaceae archaeon]
MTFSNNNPVNVAFAGLELHGTCISDINGNVLVKLSSGYNICVPTSLCTQAPERAVPPAVHEAEPLKQDANLPLLAIISTGGTIASTVDYRTGAVSSKSTVEDIIKSIPELAGIARYRTLQPFNILSENMNPAMWQKLTRAVYDEIVAGVGGVIVTHGTDTMLYSAAAVSFMLETPVPVIFVGAQRSADRPSSDNVMNAICSMKAGVSDLGEVVVCMHATTDDVACSLHRATRVRKNHTSRRDAFQSIGRTPVGTVSYPEGTVTLEDDAVVRGTYGLRLFDRLEMHCGLLQYYPGMNPDVLDAFSGYTGLVIAGTGLGHVNTDSIAKVAALTAAGTFVVMTSQCQSGEVCDRVYETGRDLLAAGVIEGGSMLPEVALVKLMWVLGNTTRREDAVRMMQTNLKGEFDHDLWRGRGE